jgi:putative membrane protein
MRISKRWWGAVVAVVVGSAAQAQIRFPEAKPKPGQPPPGQPAPPQTQPAPGQPAPQGRTAQPSQAGGLSPEQLRDLGDLSMHNQLAAQAAQLAAQRGSSEEVRRMGQKLNADHARIQHELQQLAAERQIDLDRLPRSPERERALQEHLRRLQSLSGPEFDRAFVSGMKDIKIAWEQSLKDFRERTPGQDAKLKKWVDDVENVAEEHKALARQTEQAIAGKGGQVQGRTPPRQ